MIVIRKISPGWRLNSQILCSGAIMVTTRPQKPASVDQCQVRLTVNPELGCMVENSKATLSSILSDFPLSLIWFVSK